jgi:molybdopterin converting factor subunit 1
MARFRLQYYAILREQAGRASEAVETAAATPAALYAELARRHGFRLPASQLRVAVNAAFADWEQELRDGDEVVFIPPVAGG